MQSPPPAPCPPIDDRSYDDVVRDTEALLEAYTTVESPDGESGWSPSAGPDVGSALARIFARMAKHVITRLNRAPDRSYLAFLNLIGIEPSSPRPALAPLTFSLAKGGAAEPLVPAGTRVGAKPAVSSAPDVTFQTTADVTLSRAKLASAIVLEPSKNRYSDRTAEATGEVAGYYPVFSGRASIPHSLYIAADPILSAPSGAEIIVTLLFEAGGASTFKALHEGQAPAVTWSYWNGSAWAPIPSPRMSLVAKSWLLRFSMPADLSAATVYGVTARFLRADLSAFPQTPIPAMRGASVSSEVSVTGVTPTVALSSGSPLDISMDFYPLGEQPKFNNALFLASEEVFGKPGARVEIAFKTSERHVAVSDPKRPEILWEVWSRGAWVQLGRSSKKERLTGVTSYDFDDGTFALTKGTSDATPIGAGRIGEGKVTFRMPVGAEPTEVKGKKSYWIRARLMSGDYGTGIHVSQTTTTTNGVTSTTTSITEDTYRPPIMASVELGYALSSEAQAVCYTSNDLTLVEQPPGVSFVPFVKSAEVDSALYLGFDRAFAARVTALFIDVGRVPASVARAGAISGPAIEHPLVVWEYSTESGWSSLPAEDDTRSFAQSGVVRFLGPSDIGQRSILGRRLYWLRARLGRRATHAPPLVGRALLNTVWGIHALTVTNEILGSSNGCADQSFRLSQRPVLAGERIEVKESDEAPEDARESQAAAVEVWVPWQLVPDFNTSGPSDRHYRIDRTTGEIRFGDGRYGMIPPRGARNIRARSYQTGGGAHGNVDVGAAKKLQTTIPYVAGVTNHFAASGGSDQGDLGAVRAQGARVLRHGKRAVAAEDFEDLAYEASSAVARAKAIPARFDPIDLADNFAAVKNANQVQLLLVPVTTERPPMPPLGLVRDVEGFIRERCAPTVSLLVSAPIWIEVSVTSLDIVPASLDGADALRTSVAKALERLFDPLTGGPEGRGWGFGQVPHASDIYSLLAPIREIRLLRNLTMSMVYSGTSPATPFKESEPKEIIERVLIYSGKHVVNVLSPEEAG